MPSYASLRKKFKNEVLGGNNFFFAVTNTGTGLGAVNYKLGTVVLDSSADDWFLITATAGSGTWVKVYG